MIDFTLYDYLERIVSEQDKTLEEYQKAYGEKREDRAIGINAVQSIIRRSIIDDQTDEPLYSWISYDKGSYRSTKLSNIRFDFDFILSILSNVPGIVIFDKWAIVMVVLTIFSQLRKCKVELSPAMGIIVMFLHNSGYAKKKGKSIEETVLKEDMYTEIEKNLKDINPDQEFDKAIDSLKELNVIKIQDGSVMLMEEIKI
ncbi:MAG: hypothetical protein HDQ97_16265 [Lachnospiraceae bacterium]|nr:hypothetical protein [Lachnospiraceae bacterium]